VVDDSAPFLRVLRSQLAEMTRAEILGTAQDGHRELDKVEALWPDLVLIDLGMPVMDGLEATKHIRKRYPAIRNIIITLYDEPEVRQICKISGAQRIVSQQFLHPGIFAEINRLFPEVAKRSRSQEKRR